MQLIRSVYVIGVNFTDRVVKTSAQLDFLVVLFKLLRIGGVARQCSHYHMIKFIVFFGVRCVTYSYPSIVCRVYKMSVEFTIVLCGEIELV